MTFRDVVVFLFRGTFCIVSRVLTVATLILFFRSGTIYLKELAPNLPSVVDLIYWRNVKKSGVIFSGTLLLLLALALCSFISVFSYVGLAALFVTFNFRLYKYVMHTVQKSETGNTHPFKPYLEKDLSLPQGKVHEQVDIVVRHVDDLLRHLRRLILIEDVVDSLKFAILLWAFTFVGAWFSGMTLAILAFIALFTLPKFYEVYKEPIDRYYGTAYSHVKNVADQVQEKVPFLKRKQQ